MQLSQSLEQACCVLGIIARGDGHAVTSAELNDHMKVSPSYLLKVTRKLVVADLIQSTQGVNGGYVLARPMKHITLRMVVDAIEGAEPFFRPAGIIERVFAEKGTAARRGVSLIAEALDDAERLWRHKLEKMTMHHVIYGALARSRRKS